MLEDVVRQVLEDASCFAWKDPAAGAAVDAVLRASTSFRAVLHYRLAHALDALRNVTDAACAEVACHAALVASRGKLLSGADIHPRCRIGRRFVLDHGVGAVIGETADIGDDCYLLGGVTLGAAGIAGNAAGKRHPTLGSRVEVGAFTRIFGAVEIGNDVFIGPHCVLTQDVPAGSTVTLRTSVQVIRPRREPTASHHLHKATSTVQPPSWSSREA